MEQDLLQECNKNEEASNALPDEFKKHVAMTPSPHASRRILTTRRKAWQSWPSSSRILRALAVHRLPLPLERGFPSWSLDISQLVWSAFLEGGLCAQCVGRVHPVSPPKVVHVRTSSEIGGDLFATRRRIKEYIAANGDRYWSEIDHILEERQRSRSVSATLGLVKDTTKLVMDQKKDVEAWGNLLARRPSAWPNTVGAQKSPSRKTLVETLASEVRFLEFASARHLVCAFVRHSRVR